MSVFNKIGTPQYLALLGILKISLERGIDPFEVLEEHFYDLYDEVDNHHYIRYMIQRHRAGYSLFLRPVTRFLSLGATSLFDGLSRVAGIPYFALIMLAAGEKRGETLKLLKEEFDRIKKFAELNDPMKIANIFTVFMLSAFFLVAIFLSGGIYFRFPYRLYNVKFFPKDVRIFQSPPPEWLIKIFGGIKLASLANFIFYLFMGFLVLLFILLGIFTFSLFFYTLKYNYPNAMDSILEKPLELSLNSASRRTDYFALSRLSHALALAISADLSWDSFPSFPEVVRRNLSTLTNSPQLLAKLIWDPRDKNLILSAETKEDLVRVLNKLGDKYFKIGLEHYRRLMKIPNLMMILFGGIISVVMGCSALTLALAFWVHSYAK